MQQESMLIHFLTALEVGCRNSILPPAIPQRLIVSILYSIEKCVEPRTRLDKRKYISPIRQKKIRRRP